MTIVTITILILSSSVLMSQTSLTQLKFEVASVKPNASGDDRTLVLLPPRGSVTVTNSSLRNIIGQAFGLTPMAQRFALAGGPSELLSGRYDILAKPPDGVHSRAALQQMLRTLLADRFKLRTHVETRMMPIYALTVARPGRLGPDLRSTVHDCEALYQKGARIVDPNPPVDAKGRDLCWSNYDFGAVLGVRFAGPISSVVVRGAQPYVDRAVVDATGLTGNYEWHVSFAMKPSPDLEAPEIFTAFQEQLGLRLEPRTGPVEVVIIDSVEAPSPD